MAVESARAKPADRRFQPPVMREGSAYCPRCGSQLQRDYEGLSCIACGYAYEPRPTERELWRALVSRGQRAAGIVPVAWLLARGPDPMIWVMALTTLAVAVTVAARRFVRR